MITKIAKFFIAITVPVGALILVSIGAGYLVNKLPNGLFAKLIEISGIVLIFVFGFHCGKETGRNNCGHINQNNPPS